MIDRTTNTGVRQFLSTQSNTTTIRLGIAQAKIDHHHYRVELILPRGRILHEDIHKQSIIAVPLLAELRRRYEQQVQVLHELAAAGLPVPPPDLGPLLTLGRQIAAILPEALQQALIQTISQARQRRQAVRFVLEVTQATRELLSIPWELMALPVEWEAQASGSDCFVFLNAHMSLIRQVREVGYAALVALDRPLRLQAFAATPRHAQPIDTHTSRAALTGIQSNAAIDLTWYDGAHTLGTMVNTLRTANPQVVHVLCHGEQRDTGILPLYELLFTDINGHIQRAGAGDLASVLTLAPELQLVILQSCYSGATAVRAPAHDQQNQHIAESIALALVRSGIACVIAMQGEVSQQAATAFMQALYSALAGGAGIDRAVAAGRLAMRVSGGIVDWSLPVIYQGNKQVPAIWHTPLTRSIRSVLSAARLQLRTDQRKL